MISFLLASLNYLEVFACNIDNAYPNNKCREKILTEEGTQFGNENGVVIIISIELYGLKRYGATRRTKFSETLK